jgi:hypothetical protein
MAHRVAESQGRTEMRMFAKNIPRPHRRVGGRFNNIVGPNRRHQVLLLSCTIVALVGTFLRLYQYAINRSLWVDEAMLALNIVDRSFAGLTRPLDYDQGAPIGFLLVEKTITQLFGDQDYVLRLGPLFAGILAIYLMYKVSRSYLQGMGSLVALGLFAVSWSLTYYASELKQYSSDVLVTLLLLLVAGKCLNDDPKPKHLAILAFTGAIAIWMSHPAIFVVFGIGLALGLDYVWRKDWRKVAWLGAALLPVTISFVGLYFFSLRILASNAGLLDYWRSGFMPMPPWRNLDWLGNAFAGLLRLALGIGSKQVVALIVTLVAIVPGCLSIFFRKWPVALILTAPVPAVLVASALGKYPFQGRMVLFMVPIVILLIAEGVERGRTMLHRLNPWLASAIWIVFCVFLLYQPARVAYRRVLRPSTKDDVKAVMSYLDDRRLDSDSVYVYYGAAPAFEYYAPFYGLSRDDYLVGIASREEPDKYLQDMAQLEGRARVWLVFSHNCWGCIVNEEAFFLEHLDAAGSKVDEFQAEGASLYLYDLSTQEPQDIRFLFSICDLSEAVIQCCSQIQRCISSWHKGDGL